MDRAFPDGRSAGCAEATARNYSALRVAVSTCTTAGDTK